PGVCRGKIWLNSALTSSPPRRLTADPVKLLKPGWYLPLVSGPSKLFALISDLQLELRALITHQHTPEFSPGDLPAVDRESRYTTVLGFIPPDHASHHPVIRDPQPELPVSDVHDG